MPIVLKGQSKATCFEVSGCNFAYALAMTPIITSTSPTTGNEGSTLTVTGHAFSTTVWENYITVGGSPCAVLSAENDPDYSPSSCPVTSCTGEMQTRVKVTCRIPHNDAFMPHDIYAGVYKYGTSPVLAAAKLSYSSQLRSFYPSGGSIAGGTVLYLQGVVCPTGLATSPSSSAPSDAWSSRPTSPTWRA